MDYAVNIDPDMLASLTAAQGSASMPQQQNLAVSAPQTAATAYSPAAQSFLDRIDAYEQQKRDEGYLVRRENIVGPDGDLNAAYETLGAQLDKGVSPVDLQVLSLGHAFETNKGNPAKTKSNPSGVVYATPGIKYRLVSGTGDKAVLHEGTGQEALDQIYQIADNISQTQGKKADWLLEEYEPGNDKWRAVADDDPPKKTLDTIAKIGLAGAAFLVNPALGAAVGGAELAGVSPKTIAKIGLPIAGALLAGPLGLGALGLGGAGTAAAGAALGSVAGGTIAGDSLGSILKGAALSGAGTFAGASLLGGLGGQGFDLAGSLATTNAGVNSILANTGGAVAGGLGGGLGAAGGSALGGAAGGLGAGAYDAVGEIVAQGLKGAGSALSNVPAAIAGGAGSLASSTLSNLATQQPNYGDEPGTTVTASPPTGPTAPPVAVPGIDLGTVAPESATITAEAQQPPPPTNQPPVIVPPVGIDLGTVAPESATIVAEAQQPPPQDVPPVVIPPINPLPSTTTADVTSNGSTEATNNLGPNPTLSQIIDYLQAAGWLTGFLGDLLGGGGGNAHVPSGWGSSGLGGVFTKTLPTASLPGVNGRTTRLMPPQDWTKYGTRPEQSFWSNVPQFYTPPPPGQYDLWSN